MPVSLSRRHALFLGAALLASGCASNPPMKRLPEMSFRHLPPIRLNVGRIEVVPQYQAPAQRPHIEYDMPVSPENALKRWVQDRLQPVGTTGTLRVVIKDASATETPLATDQGFTGMFKTEQASRVSMSLNVALQMLDDHQFVISEVNGESMRSRTLPEGQKLNERDQVLYDMVEDLMRNFNDNIEPGIRSTFGRWLGV